MPTRLPEAWPKATKKGRKSELHPLAVGCIILLGVLHVAGSFILQGSVENLTAVLSDVSSCARQFESPVTTLPYD